MNSMKIGTESFFVASDGDGACLGQAQAQVKVACLGLFLIKRHAQQTSESLSHSNFSNYTFCLESSVPARHKTSSLTVISICLLKLICNLRGPLVNCITIISLHFFNSCTIFGIIIISCGCGDCEFETDNFLSKATDRSL